MDGNEFSTLASYPSFHDGHIRSLAVRNGVAVIGLEQVTGASFELFLEGVEALQADDFRTGNLTNIIYNLTVITGQKPERKDLAGLFSRLFPAPTGEQLDRVVARIENGETVMVILDASLGCDLVAICHAVRLVKIDGGSTA